MPNAIHLNARDLERELSWFNRVVDTRLKLYFGQESEFNDVFDIDPPDLSDSESTYAGIVRQYQMTIAERLMLILALVPHIRPWRLDVFFTKNATTDRPFTEFGGIREDQEGGFFPTGETLAFLLAGQDLELRIQVLALFDRDHYFTRHQIFDLQHDDASLFFLKTPLRLTQEYLGYFIVGTAEQPQFGIRFPAHRIETRLEWDDLVLAPETLALVREIETWLTHSSTLMQDWDMAAKLPPGFHALFYGPPGHGKTTAACLLGKSSGREVYRVNLPMAVSKYIGETEKNLASIFDKAEHKQWVLFFDEADALFGKRSDTSDAHNRFANQEVGYFLQRIATFSGVAILASHLDENPDNELSRRFDTVIHFPMPGEAERLRIWQNGFPPQVTLDSRVKLPTIARKYKLSGGAILNVIRYVTIEALRNGSNVITMASIQQGVKRELSKVGK
ncbi:MAG: ATP-binding protein [Lewinellaceae bacterium]|jgi:hypothetical protein|nr:ATP-binding protein [Lewinellaceae bacterium]